jgi:hypothetical protein
MTSPPGIPTIISREEMLRHAREVMPEFGLSGSEMLAYLSEEPDAQTHLNLAIAYREMGLPADALVEAAQAIRLAQLPQAQSSLALEMLLEPGRLRVNVTAALDLIRNSHFQN